MNKLNKVPVNHRILLHLRSYQRYRDRFEVPFALSQMGIAGHVLIHRAAAARSLKEMTEKGFIISRTKHVVRGSRKRKVYFLTDEGLRAAQEVE
ncbi:MAG: helix-turn-helix transcriptional regulator, partial [Thermoplasmata archaeon]|nr:helix-turn-helix transcriptional regulator [Thermoplasmata archaeon]